MYFAANTILKPISMAANGCFTSCPSIFSAANKIPSKPMKSHYLFSVKMKDTLFRFSVTAANQEGGSPVFLEEREKEQGQLFKGDFNWGASENDDENGVARVVPSDDANKVYVGNLSYDVDSENLAQIFEQAGVVETAQVICHKESNQSRGFGFVTMSTEEEAEKAVELLNRHDVNGRPLVVNKAGQKGSRPERAPRPSIPSYKIYAGNLPWSLDNSRLEEIFSEHGKVVRARVSSDIETGRSRGFGFVVMSSESEMNDAIANLDGQTLDGRAIKVSAAEDRPRRNIF